MKLSTALQPCGIYVQLQILQTIWQHDTDQTKMYFIIAQRVKLNVAAKGKDYSLMWTKVEFRSVW
jgi:hypothetical protein